MKKIFLMLAFTGIIGAASWDAMASEVKNPLSIVKGGNNDKDKKDKKDKKTKCASGEEKKKGCCKARKSCNKDANTSDKNKIENSDKTTIKGEEKK